KRRTLPNSTKRIGDVKVELGTVKRPVARVDLVASTGIFERPRERGFRVLPSLQLAHEVLRAGGELDVVLHAELSVKKVKDLQHVQDLSLDLVFSDKDMGVVLVKTPDTHQAVQRSGHFVAGERPVLGDPE